MQLLICQHAWLKFDNRLKLVPESEDDKNCFLCPVIFCCIKDFIIYTFCILTLLLIYRYFGWILLKKKQKITKGLPPIIIRSCLTRVRGHIFKCNISHFTLLCQSSWFDLPQNFILPIWRKKKAFSEEASLVG